jgi:hypothetical protein
MVPVEDFCVEHATIPVSQQTEVNVPLAVPELPGNTPQDFLTGREV